MSDLVFLRSIDTQMDKTAEEAPRWHPLKQLAVISACALTCWSFVAVVLFVAKEFFALCGVA